MAYLGIIDPLAELGKLSQGKSTKVAPDLIAKLAIDRIRELEGERKSDNAVVELERLYTL